jgi:hypothetical protein
MLVVDETACPLAFVHAINEDENTIDAEQEDGRQEEGLTNGGRVRMAE